MEQDSNPPLPRSPDDPDRLRRLREEALRRLDDEERLMPLPGYGGAAPVYGGPPVGPSVTRRWTLRGLLLAGAALIAVLLAKVFGIMPGPAATVYGGPPVKPVQPEPKPPAPVYGGPVPPPVPPPHKPPLKQKPAPGHPDPLHRPTHSSSATVYGGPVPPPIPPAPPPK